MNKSLKKQLKNYEVELKFPSCFEKDNLPHKINIPELKLLLNKLEFQYQRIFFQKDIYYNHPCRNFAESDEALRIRSIKKEIDKDDFKTKLTYKGPKIGTKAKTREEYELDIEDTEKMDKLLISLEFKQIGIVEKEREEWLSSDREITFSIDTIKGLGVYIEIEKITSDKNNIESIILQLSELGKKLGLKNHTNKSYIEMILEKKSKDNE